MATRKWAHIKLRRQATKCETHVKGRRFAVVVAKINKTANVNGKSRWIARAIYIFIAKSYKNQLHGWNNRTWQYHKQKGQSSVFLCLLHWKLNETVCVCASASPLCRAGISCKANRVIFICFNTQIIWWTWSAEPTTEASLPYVYILYRWLIYTIGQR